MTVSTQSPEHKVSRFENFVKNLGDTTFKEIIEEVRSQSHAESVYQIRKALKVENTEEADKIKKRLPAFTPSGTFRGDRRSENFDEHSDIIHLDIDDQPEHGLTRAIMKVLEIPYTRACYKSPSGRGAKIFVKANVAKVGHASAYKAVQSHYEKALDLVADGKCKDIARLCFLSHDPAAYYNDNSETFPDELIQLSDDVEPDFSTKLVEIKDFTDQKQQFIQGNRNNYVHQFACNANREGVPLGETINFCKLYFSSLGLDEIVAAVTSAYRTNGTEFAKFAEFVRPSSDELQDDDSLSTTPTIPLEVYLKLPALLKDGARVFKNQREKDLFLTTAIAVLSGCIPNLTGVYKGRKVFGNMYIFVVAPAASGKGSMQYAKQLADCYHETTLKQSNEALQEYKRKLRNLASTESDELPIRPPFKVVFIPADVSSAKVIQHLADNEGAGIFFETEADTLVQAFKKEWGLNSDMLRKAFHAEKISVSRKTDNEFLEVNDAHPAVVLSGTPSQSTNLICSPEDGLFSRFVFYAYKSEYTWDDVSPAGQECNLTEHFQALSERVLVMTQFFLANETNVNLTNSQWMQLNTKFADYMKDVVVFTTEDAAGIIRRLGLIMYRICMVLTALRKFERKTSDTDVICCDADFETACKLIDVYLQHSLVMLTRLPKRGKSDLLQASEQKKRFFQALPDTFKRIDAVKIGESFGFKASAVDKFLKKLVGTFLTKSEYGIYTKIR